MEAIVRISGKQYRLATGQRVEVDRLDAEIGSEVSFDQVLMLTGDGAATIGKPLVEGASVKAKVLSHDRGPKLLVFKYKPKKRYRRIRGHRAAHSRLEVLSVEAGSGA